MEFGLDQLRTGLRPGSIRFELSRYVEMLEPARTWSQTGSKLVADRSEDGRRPASSC